MKQNAPQGAVPFCVFLQGAVPFRIIIIINAEPLLKDGCKKARLVTIFFQKIRICFADFPYQLCSMGQRLLTYSSTSTAFSGLQCDIVDPFLQQALHFIAFMAFGAAGAAAFLAFFIAFTAFMAFGMVKIGKIDLRT